MEGENKNKTLTDVKIKNVPVEKKRTLENIARNEGQTLSGFIKSQITKIIASYPDNMKVGEPG